MKNDIRACLLITVSVHVFVQCTPSHTQTCTHKYVDTYISNNMGKIWINIPQNRKGFFSKKLDDRDFIFMTYL